MAGETDGATPEGGPRAPEPGVSFFYTFLVALVAGFALVLAGMPTLGALLLVVAIISVIAMALRPSPRALARREASRPPPEDVDDGGPEERGAAGADIEAPASPTEAGTSAPAPPPERPPPEDVTVELGEADEEDEEGAT